MLYFLLAMTLLAQVVTPPPAKAQTWGHAAFLLHSLNLTSSNNKNHLEAFIEIRNPLHLQQGLTDGATINIEIEVGLEQIRFLLPNRSLAQFQLVYQLNFDPVTREYVILRPNLPVLRNRALPAVLELALSDLVIPLPSLTPQDHNANYAVSLTLAMYQTNIPAWLEKTLFFWSWEVIAKTTFRQNLTLDNAPISQSPIIQPYPPLRAMWLSTRRLPEQTHG